MYINITYDLITVPEHGVDIEDIDDLVKDRSGETFSDCDCKGETKKTKRVLFIGNSFTFYNDMPDMVRQLAECACHKLILDTQVTGGRSLQEHFEDGTVKYKIRDGKSGKPWDLVVLNEKTIIPAYSNKTICSKMYPAAKELTEYIREYNPGVKIQWYMTWGYKHGHPEKCENNKDPYPFCSYEDMQERIKETYM